MNREALQEITSSRLDPHVERGITVRPDPKRPFHLCETTFNSLERFIWRWHANSIHGPPIHRATVRSFYRDARLMEEWTPCLLNDVS